MIFFLLIVVFCFTFLLQLLFLSTFGTFSLFFYVLILKWASSFIFWFKFNLILLKYICNIEIWNFFFSLFKFLLQEADDLIKKMVKKHSQNREVWIKAFVYCFKANELTEARNMLDRSLLSLPKADRKYKIVFRFMLI